MKFSILTISTFLFHLTSTTPIEKRASVTDVATTGYATLNGGTSGGRGGPTVTVTTLSALTSAVGDDSPRIVLISSTISGAAMVRVGSNKSIIGKSGSKLVGIGIYIKGKKNVIVRNLTSQKVLAVNGDAIGIQLSTNVWVDHCDLSSDRSHSKDYYDGLLDVTHAADFVTVSNTYFHDHWKASLVGHSDSNGGEDTGHLRITYHNNWWSNINSRTPSIRFGTGHVYNSLFQSCATGVNTRENAQVLVQSSVFEGTPLAIESADSPVKGAAVVQDVNLGGGTNTAPAGSLRSVPYGYSLLGSGATKSNVMANAGAKLGF